MLGQYWHVVWLSGWLSSLFQNALNLKCVAALLLLTHSQLFVKKYNPDDKSDASSLLVVICLTFK